MKTTIEKMAVRLADEHLKGNQRGTEYIFDWDCIGPAAAGQEYFFGMSVSPCEWDKLIVAVFEILHEN